MMTMINKTRESYDNRKYKTKKQNFPQDKQDK